jgi:hypothetical protein
MDLQQPDERLSRQITDELASAFKEFCTALSEIADEARRGEVVSAEQVERAEEAKLRIENARTFLELCVCRREANAPLKTRPH